MIIKGVRPEHSALLANVDGSAEVDAVLAVGQAPNLVLIMPGRYDAQALYATWVANGYQAVEIEETTVWALNMAASPNTATRP